MAIVMPIVTQYSGKGLNQAITEINKAEGAFGKVAAASKLANIAMGAALVAAGAFAVKLGVDGVQAAMAEQAELTKLQKTLDNLGFGGASAHVNQFVDDLRFSTGVADSQLRPAFDRLVRSTRDVGQAQEALKIALDVSTGSGKSLESVAMAIGKAYDGNTAGLSKLGVGLSNAALKSGDLKTILGSLSATFAGQATAAAQTFEGQIRRVKDGFSEAQEAFGTGFLESFTKGANGASASADQLASDLRQMQSSAQQLGSVFGNILKGISFGFQVLRGTIVITVNEMMNAADLYTRLATNINDFLGITSDQEAEHTRRLLDAEFQARETAKYEELLGYKFAQAGDAAAGAVPQIDAFTAAAFGAGAAAATIYTGGTPTAAYNGINAMGNMVARVKDMAAKAKEAAAQSRSLAGGVKATGAAAEKTYPQVEKLTKWIEGNKKNLDGWASKLKEAKDALASYAADVKATFTTLDLQGALEAQATWVTETAKLDAAIAEAIAKGDSEGQAKAAAEKAALGAAVSWVAVFAQQIQDSKAAQDAVKALTASLNPADTVGNKALIDSVLGLKDPQLIKQAADDLVKQGVGPELAAQLSQLDVWSEDTANAFALTFMQPGVLAAQTQYDAIAQTLEKNLGKLYALGKKLGKSVMDGYNSIVSGLPADVKLPKSMPGGGQLQAGPSPVVVNITAGIGNPVQIAREVRSILNSSQVRLGVA